MVTNVVTRRGISKRKTANSLRISGLRWCHQDSNRGHTDFQSDALPTELWHQLLRFCDAKLGVFFELCKFYGAVLSTRLRFGAQYTTNSLIFTTRQNFIL